MNKPIQPTEEMIKAGIEQRLTELPGLEDDVDEEQLSDVVCFVWQAMWTAG